MAHARTVVSLLAASACGGGPPAALPDAGVFAGASRVTVSGYDGDLMEPFVTKDGRYLLFNNRNDPAQARGRPIRPLPRRSLMP